MIIRVLFAIGAVFFLVWLFAKASRELKQVERPKEIPSSVENSPPVITPPPLAASAPLDPMEPITFGGRLIFFSFFLALASLYFNWAEVKFMHLFSLGSRTGWVLGMVFLVFVLWSIPLSKTIGRKPFSALEVKVLSVFALIVPCVVSFSILSKGWGPVGTNLGYGFTLFGVACAMLVFGMLLNKLTCWISNKFRS